MLVLKAEAQVMTDGRLCCWSTGATVVTGGPAAFTRVAVKYEGGGDVGEER